MTAEELLGPLRHLAGTWEGGDGLDVSFSHQAGKVIETPYRERTTFSPFGPVENGRQVLYGLDYRTAAWRGDEEDPFHTEVGYWLWDAEDGQVLRCFAIPRGIVLIAGGQAGADDRSFTLTAEVGSESYGILSNRVLAGRAPSVRFEVAVTTGDRTFGYDETTWIDHELLDEQLHHTDRNTLRRVD